MNMVRFVVYFLCRERLFPMGMVAGTQVLV